MHIGTHYTLVEFLRWTRRDIYGLLAVSTVPTLLYMAGLTWLAIPWVPVALIGTAAAFIVGFKNTQTYNRLWEARQIWGSIINGSRTWGIMVRDFVKTDRATSGRATSGQASHHQLIYRHCAWLTALRNQLRKPQSWENQEKPYNKEYGQFFTVPEWQGSLDDALVPYLPETERLYILTKKNRATQLIAGPSKQLTSLKDAGLIDPFEYVELERRLADFYNQQGRCERIKNFPYPRQFASITLYFIWIFVLMLPLGMLNEFHKLGDH